MIPVSCSLCAWTSEAETEQDACRLGDAHLFSAHDLPAELGVDDDCVEFFFGCLACGKTFHAIGSDVPAEKARADAHFIDCQGAKRA